MPSPHIHYVRHITKLYRQAEDRTKFLGRAWYRREHAYAARLARASGRPIRNVCACLAVLSPRCRWPRAKTACEDLLAGRKPTGIFNRSIKKARSVLAANGTIPIDPHRQPKTWAFWQNLWRPVDPYPVTLDSWMLRAHGVPKSVRPSRYNIIAEAYRSAARDLGLIPNQLQATIWLHVKEAHHLNHSSRAPCPFP